MYLYQIAKYNPKYRNINGVYLVNDWTSMSDIGQIYNGRVLDAVEYFTTENMYIKAIKLIMNCLQIETLDIKGLEKNFYISNFYHMVKKYPDLYPDRMTEVYQKVREGIKLDSDELSELCRLVLREHLWCYMISEDKEFVISFGYDYFIKIVCGEVKKEIINSIRDTGLFVEIQDANEIEIDIT